MEGKTQPHNINFRQCTCTDKLQYMKETSFAVPYNPSQRTPQCNFKSTHNIKVSLNVCMMRIRTGENAEMVSSVKNVSLYCHSG